MNRYSINCSTTLTFTLFPIKRYFVFVDTFPGHEKVGDVPGGIKSNNRKSSVGEKYRRRSGFNISRV
jgi:hypothetical protein